MNKLNANEKSRGVVLFAFNSAIDYVSIARNCARLVQKNLKLPVTLITDNYIDGFDNVIVVNNNLNNFKSAFDNNNWKNSDRYRAYELSPYDETLLIDTDYLVLDTSLLKLFESDYDYRIMQSNRTLTEKWNLDMGSISVPYMWATVVLFKKTQRSKMLFDLVGKIQRNYTYYRKLYNIREGNFRNDYAFTIANLILNGHTDNVKSNIIWPMLTLDKKINQLELKDNFIIIREQDGANIVANQNIHIIDKQYLLTENFNNFVDKICKD